MSPLSQTSAALAFLLAVVAPASAEQLLATDVAAGNTADRPRRPVWR